ncbi:MULTISPECIES: hypothetical protein [unclassified Dehalobacter]|uniref:hypothetical protein n=1 Tax=unclassified Dehalobacter TaxID=2635733 RepID=UPI001FA6FB11|nr:MULTISPECIES: hypothetical protein [unclassified Dehalobacter]
MPELLRKRWKIPLVSWTTKANCLPSWFPPPATPWTTISPIISPTWLTAGETAFWRNWTT